MSLRAGPQGLPPSPSPAVTGTWNSVSLWSSGHWPLSKGQGWLTQSLPRWAPGPAGGRGPRGSQSTFRGRAGWQKEEAGVDQTRGPSCTGGGGAGGLVGGKCGCCRKTHCPTRPSWDSPHRCLALGQCDGSEAQGWPDSHRTWRPGVPGGDGTELASLSPWVTVFLPLAVEGRGLVDARMGWGVAGEEGGQTFGSPRPWDGSWSQLLWLLVRDPQLQGVGGVRK